MTEIKTKSIEISDVKHIGQVIRLSRDPGVIPSLSSDVLDFYGGLAIIDSSASLELGICFFHHRPLLLDGLERHRKSQELIYAVDDDFIICAACHDEGRNGPDPATVTALRIPRASGIVFHRGIWHGVPFSLGKDSFALVGFAKGTANDDMTIHTFPEPVCIVI